MSGICLALIGGGRWARTHASVLAQFSTRVERVLWVTRHNSAAASTFIAQNSAAAPAFELFSSVDAALAERPDAAIVVTADADHAATAEILLRHGVPTLVEKPLALSSQSATRLIELAEQRNVALCVALHLLKADFLHHFRQLWTGRRIDRIELEWIDPDFEMRHGEAKFLNLTANKVDEAMPHLWSILKVLQNEEEPQLRAVRPRPRGAVELEIDVGSSRASVLFGRRAAARKRALKLAFQDGGTAEIDFTTEPGRIEIDGADCPNLDAGNRITPIAAELGDFLDIVDRRQDVALSTQLAARCLGSVTLTETVRELLMDKEAHAVALRLTDGGSMHEPEVSAWIIDNIAPLLGAQGTRIDNADQATAGRIIEAVHQAVIGSCAETSCRSEASPAMVTTVRQSRFFALLREHLARLQK
jgi:hypothetical protein